jgi:hypothetical protein
MFRLLLINIALIIVTTAAVAQQADTVVVDSLTRINHLPTGIRIGTDLISLGKSQFQDNFTGWEINADIDFYRYFLALDYGSWGRTFTSDSGHYSNDGTYWRAGVDINFLVKDIDRNMFFIGFRYGRANFSEDLNVYVQNYFVDDSFVTLNYSHSGIKAHWFELTSGLRVKVWKMIWMGYTARFKFGLKYGSSENIIPSDVPGYGRTEKDSYWGFNYQLFFRIPLRKQQVLIFPKK